VNAWVNNQEAGRLYMPPSAASAIGSEIHEAIEMKRRKNALGPYWDSLDQDALDERLMEIMRCHRPRQLLTEDATVKDMKFFGAAKAGYLAKYTPGNVVVVEAMMGFSPELDMIRVRVDESIWRYPFRAKSKRDLKRLGKDRAAAHEPVVTTVATHLYEYQMRPPPPAGSSSVLLPDAPAPADPEPYFKRMGALWRANDSAALKEHLEKAFTFVADSMRQRNGSDCD
jgi:hypothetical protein